MNALPNLAFALLCLIASKKLADYTAMRSFPALLVLALFFAVGSSSAQHLQCNPCWDLFPKTPVGQSNTYTFELTNTGTQVLQVTSITLPEGAFSLGNIKLPASIQPGQSVPMPVIFAPTTVGFDYAEFFIFSNDRYSPRRGQVSGSGVSNGNGGGGGSAQLTISPATLSFGSVNVGSSASLQATLSATGGSVTISSGTTSSSQFAVSGLTFPLTIPAGQSVQATIQFTPTAAGAVTGQDDFVSNANSPGQSLTGTGVSNSASSQLTISPSTLSFGNVTVGSTASLQATLTASNGAVTISSDASSTSEFAITGVSLPVTIPAGQSIQATIQFTPNASGAASAQDQFISNATNSPSREQLTGTGVAAASHSATLTWQAGASGITGYNVYRGAANGGPYSQLNSSLVASTSYTDSTVVGGSTYYYVTTEVNSQGQESGYSNVAEAQIP